VLPERLGNPATEPLPYNDSTFMSKSFLF